MMNLFYRIYPPIKKKDNFGKLKRVREYGRGAKSNVNDNRKNFIENIMRLKLILIVPLIFITANILSQKIYRTSGGELIFSRSINNSPFFNTTSRIRVSLFLHYNSNYHYDFTKNLGIYSGVSISNIGFSYKTKDTTYKKRAYTLGIPLGLKFGNVGGNNYLFAGGELELPFHYKQKRLIGNQKNKYSSFFDRRVNSVLPSLFAGIQFSEGFCFKLRLYLNDFLNKEFTGFDFGVRTQYKNSDSKLFLLSLSYNLKENKIKKIIKNENRYANLNI